jgi:hypothetical protein
MASICADVPMCILQRHLPYCNIFFLLYLYCFFLAARSFLWLRRFFSSILCIFDLRNGVVFVSTHWANARRSKERSLLWKFIMWCGYWNMTIYSASRQGRDYLFIYFFNNFFYGIFFFLNCQGNIEHKKEDPAFGTYLESVLLISSHIMSERWWILLFIFIYLFIFFFIYLYPSMPCCAVYNFF